MYNPILAKLVNDSGQVDMLVLDFAKAFDTVALLLVTP